MDGGAGLTPHQPTPDQQPNLAAQPNGGPIPPIQAQGPGGPQAIQQLRGGAGAPEPFAGFTPAPMSKLVTLSVEQMRLMGISTDVVQMIDQQRGMFKEVRKWQAGKAQMVQAQQQDTPLLQTGVGQLAQQQQRAGRC